MLFVLSASLVIVGLYLLLRRYYPYPIGDEKYHVPQGRRDWEGTSHFYDPMISTPPGLYNLSSIILTFLHLDCNIHTLRLTTILYSLWIVRVFGDLGVLICLSPVVLPYTQLYYTDIGSLLGVLGALGMFCEENFLLSALVRFFDSHIIINV